MTRSEEIKAKIDECAARFRVRKMDRDVAQGEAFMMLSIIENSVLTDCSTKSDYAISTYDSEVKKKSAADSDLDELNNELSTLWIDYRFWRERELHDESVMASRPVPYEANAKLKSELIIQLQCELSEREDRLRRANKSIAILEDEIAKGLRERYSVAQVERACMGALKVAGVDDAAKLTADIVHAL